MAVLTPLGIVHTAISLVALGTGAAALIRYRQFSPGNQLGFVYLVTTALTAATGLGIFQHGGFGPPHVLSLLTLMALAVGTAAVFKAEVFGRWALYVQAVCYTATVLFHLIPGFTETLTRLPPGNPVLPGPEAPQFGPIYGVLLLAWAAGLVVQLRWLHGQMVREPVAMAA